jgi:hypothetical protein
MRCASYWSRKMQEARLPSCDTESGAKVSAFGRRGTPSAEVETQKEGRMKHLDIEWMPSTLVAMTMTVVSSTIEAAGHLNPRADLPRCPVEKGPLTKVIILAREQGRIRAVANSTVNCSLAASQA